MNGGSSILDTIFAILTEPLGLPLSPLWEWLILLLIEAIAYIFAYRFVGELYSESIISSSGAGLVFHWIIRFVTFVIVWWITYHVIIVGKFIYQHTLIFIIMSFVSVITVLTYFAYKHTKKKQFSNEDTSI